MAYLDHLPDVALTGDDGRVRSFHEMLSGVLVVSMFYASCEVRCVPAGRLTTRVRVLLGPAAPREGIEFALISLDPDADTPERLRAYRRAVGASDLDRIGFYRGDRAKLEHLRFRLGMMDERLEVDRDPSQHKSHSVVINSALGQTRHVAPFLNPMEFARVILQLCPGVARSRRTRPCLADLQYDSLPPDELYENATSLHPRYTLPGLPPQVRAAAVAAAQEQAGRLTPLGSDGRRHPPRAGCSSCCGSKSSPSGADPE